MQCYLGLQFHVHQDRSGRSAQLQCSAVPQIFDRYFILAGPVALWKRQDLLQGKNPMAHFADATFAGSLPFPGNLRPSA